MPFRSFRLWLAKGTLFSEEGPEIRSVAAEVRAMEGWLRDNFELAGGGLACICLEEDASTYLASNVLDPAAKAQQPADTDFSPAVWEGGDADRVRGTAARMEQLSVHALLVQLFAPTLVSEGEIPPAPGAIGFGGGGKKASSSTGDVKPPVWQGMDYQLQRQPGDEATARGWQRGHWQALSPLTAPVAAPLEWVEPVLVG